MSENEKKHSLKRLISFSLKEEIPFNIEHQDENYTKISLVFNKNITSNGRNFDESVYNLAKNLETFYKSVLNKENDITNSIDGKNLFDYLSVKIDKEIPLKQRCNHPNWMVFEYKTLIDDDRNTIMRANKLVCSTCLTIVDINEKPKDETVSNIN